MYGNYFSNPYQPAYMPQPAQDNLAQLRNAYAQPQMAQQTAPSGDDRIWVQGEVGAKAYLTAAGNTVTLWDSESQSIYLKTVNAAGVPTLTKLKYTIDSPQAQPDPSQYVTRAELKALVESMMKGDKENDKSE